MFTRQIFIKLVTLLIFYTLAENLSEFQFAGDGRSASNGIGQPHRAAPTEAMMDLRVVGHPFSPVLLQLFFQRFNDSFHLK